METNDFIACYVIYNCSIQIMRLPVSEWDGRMHHVLIIRHDFDTDWLLLVLEENEKDTIEVSAKLELKALEYSKESMASKMPDQTNRYSFGKVYVRIRGLDHMPNIGKLFFRVKLGPFSLESRRLKIPTKDRYKVNQDFYLPVSNRFDMLQVEIVSYITTGLF